MVPATDRDAILAAVESLGLADSARARIVLIPDTPHLEDLSVSEAVAKALRDRTGITIASKPEPFRFGGIGQLSPMAPPA